MINGATITARTIPPAKIVKPVGCVTLKRGMELSQRLDNGAAIFCTKGTMASRPQTPYTTGGMAANKSSTGLAMERIALCAYSERYRATSKQGTTASSMPTIVTQAVPMMKGQNPNEPSSGFHITPSIVSWSVWVPMIGQA